ncbi:M949_RS01915 family surface polysaccharide biosynthesis protein [Pedobacter nototheniae]|uniref:M949_RS01915 family surface polysaccharide biosynthesis protein n=1 Tax=Pedobacter nototheniae TaxID=2488994 RepID=UPI002930F81D|nr:hypothetical protein [Pedobacter nototheniae]
MRTIFTILAVLFFIPVFGQTVKSTISSKILTDQEVSSLLPVAAREKLGISFPIFRVYGYNDRSGQYYCVLTESRDVVNRDKDAFNKVTNYKIKAINFKSENGSLTKTWEINDRINPKMHGEESIWFWTKYAQFNDYNNDGLITPIIVYGTQGMNYYDDGRVKIIIYYKGQKIAIRHQNGVLDDERDTSIDQAFYALPIKLQESIKEKMNLLVTNQHAIFPYGWQKAMQKKKIFFSERGD